MTNILTEFREDRIKTVPSREFTLFVAPALAARYMRAEIRLFVNNLQWVSCERNSSYSF